jgi:FAD/FMN-containing dehydrogenase
MTGWSLRIRGVTEWVNDIHSQLNRTRVSAIRRPRSIEELQSAIREKGTFSVAGGRHAMGGQQFGSDTTLLDMGEMNRVLEFDSREGIVEVEGGIQWPELISWLVSRQQSISGRQWGIAQKQTGADRLSLGGALAANIHGRGLTMKPIIGDVESLVLIGADGQPIECSRRQNSELFSLVIGGYGLFGVIATIRLRLIERQKVERVVEVRDIDDIVTAFDQGIAAGFRYGDFQFSFEEQSERFLRSGVFACYRPVSADAEVDSAQAELDADDWRRILYLAHADKERLYHEYTRYYLSTSGQIYWSDQQQLGIYLDDYHGALDQALRAPTPATEIITEIYVPRERLVDFMAAAREEFRNNGVSIIYGTVRLIEKDDESFLAWARQPYACIIFNLHTEHSVAGMARSAAAFRALIDLAIARNGSYFLTYHRYATREQVEACYPQFSRFLEHKSTYDPDGRFQSDWYRHYRQMFRRETEGGGSSVPRFLGGPSQKQARGTEEPDS